MLEGQTHNDVGGGSTHQDMATANADLFTVNVVLPQLESQIGYDGAQRFCHPTAPGTTIRQERAVGS